MTQKERDEAKRRLANARALLTENQEHEFAVKGSWVANFVGRCVRIGLRDADFLIVRWVDAASQQWATGVEVTLPLGSEHIKIEVIK
jgi:hypothetical protein